MKYKIITLTIPEPIHKRIVRKMQKKGFHSVLELNAYILYLITKQLKK